MTGTFASIMPSVVPPTTPKKSRYWAVKAMTARLSGHAEAYRSKVLPNYGITSAMPWKASMLTRVPLALGGRLWVHTFRPATT